jgi:hypothetical protein
MADLLDKLGKAIVQRDEAVKEKTRLKAQLHQNRMEVRIGLRLGRLLAVPH